MNELDAETIANRKLRTTLETVRREQNIALAALRRLCEGAMSEPMSEPRFLDLDRARKYLKTVADSQEIIRLLDFSVRRNLKDDRGRQ